MADYGIKIGKPGQDIKTAADKDLVWTSKNNGLNIFKHNVAASAGNVAHGAGYVPMHLTYCKVGDRYSLDGRDTWTIVGGVQIWGDAPSIDDTNIIFPSTNNYYFIFVDKLA